MNSLPEERADCEAYRRVLEMVLNHVDQGISYFNHDLLLVLGTSFTESSKETVMAITKLKQEVTQG